MTNDMFSRIAEELTKKLDNILARNTDELEGEELQINWGVAIGGEGVGGYVLANIRQQQAGISHARPVFI